MRTKSPRGVSQGCPRLKKGRWPSDWPNSRRSTRAYAREIKRFQESVTVLRLGEQRFRSLVEAITAIVWSTPASGEFAVEQPRWTDFTGQTFEQLRGLDAIPFSLRDRLGDAMKTLALRAHRKGLELACRYAARVPDEHAFRRRRL